MSRTISSGYVVSRKDYVCDASYWWHRSGYSPDDCDHLEQSVAVRHAMGNNFKILKGERYFKATIEDGGELTTYRAIPSMHQVVSEMNLFDE